jgi:chaperonin cofactor prefoldin
MKVIPIQNETGLVRDIKSRAVLSTNKEEIDTYRKRKQKSKDIENRINTLESMVRILQDTVEGLQRRINSDANNR